MFSIVIPKEPQIEEFGISEKEIPQIQSFDVKPIKYGKTREEKLKTWSIISFFSVLYLILIFLLYYNHGWHMRNGDSIFIPSFKLLIEITFTFVIPIIGIMLTKKVLAYIIPYRLVHDTYDEYDDQTTNMIKKKNKLEQYNKAVKQYTRDIERIKKEYPMADSVFPIGMKDNDARYPQLFKAYIQKVIKESFLPSFKDDISVADKLEEKRASKEWWETLSPFDFEKEVGKWYQKKGYRVNVTAKSNDGGVDVVLTMNGETTYVQCKQWNDQVPVGVVRELFGVMASHGVKKGIVVCLNGGTKGAVDFANDNGIRIVTHHDFVKETKPISKTYTSRDIGTYWQYGNYFILYDAWKDVEDAINTINKTNYTSRNFVVGLCKWESFYLGVAINKTINRTLLCFEYIIDAEKGKIIFEKPRRVLSSSNSYRPDKKKRKRDGWYGSRW
jgi:HJR/Mrr/RecB family endonuclease